MTHVNILSEAHQILSELQGLCHFDHCGSGQRDNPERSWGIFVQAGYVKTHFFVQSHSSSLSVGGVQHHFREPAFLAEINHSLGQSGTQTHSSEQR